MNRIITFERARRMITAAVVAHGNGELTSRATFSANNAATQSGLRSIGVIVDAAAHACSAEDHAELHHLL